MDQLWRSSLVSGGNAPYVEALYESYLTDPNSVPQQWRDYFDKLPRVNGQIQADVPHSTVVEHFQLLGRAKRRPDAVPHEMGSTASEYERKQVRVVQMIQAYRQRGHQKAALDPLGLAVRPAVPDLDMHFHQLSGADKDTVFQTGNLHIGKAEAPLSEILDALEQTYCRTIGAEFMHIVATEERFWVMQRMESVRAAPDYSKSVRLHLLERLTAAEGMENLLASRYPGTKRFGLEGGESLIPMMDELIQRAGSYGVKEVVIGMAHRGRLNVLVNIFGKNPAELFDEFEEKKAPGQGSGDVKYHQGFSSNVHTPGGEVHLALAFNPSHLEVVSPVVEGSVRARQDRREDHEHSLVVPIILHGDAAFAGQGVVMETFQMSQTRAYKTGGTIHIVINNQVGFTTSRQDDARSTEYCTDVAKMVQAPIFHVNGDDPEAVLFVTQMAMDYRQTFHKDVVIDLVCYRRRGHNEADEPSVTQPLMYDKIRSHASTRELYSKRLVELGLLDDSAAKAMTEEYRNALDSGLHVVKSLASKPNTALFVDWTPYLGHEWNMPYDTRIPIKELQAIGQKANEVPAGFVAQRQVDKIMQDRRVMVAGGQPVNWGCAEVLAYATLVHQGYPVRLTGQDVGRGTFSHRHAVLHHQKDGSVYVPLQNMAPDQPVFTIHDSLLSEMAVLGFEYGYATTAPNALVIWEAQFGDFANNAQVVIDQFISSGESKWGRLCGLTMLLPHGYEGQGPEHSSARLERYLQLCAEHNMQICIPSTPAQVYHMIRRQAIRPLRKPLIAFTPKSLLRHKEAISTLEELADGTFQLLIDDVSGVKPAKVKRLVLCSGKVYYDLAAERDQQRLKDVAIVRIEQLYPFPAAELLKLLSSYPDLEAIAWCQEEPMNQGAWYSSQHHMRHALQQAHPGLYLQFAGREASAAPAAGYMSVHLAQQKALVAEALGLVNESSSRK
ncbi:MAG: 2-oxoglutarate dehydrogenase E1 component [Gammaproteobacteria bacterium]|nr:MAG: 2-oxoglutarate dehydrogenase E1 component [Gammaproteobacteria bacterium]